MSTDITPTPTPTPPTKLTLGEFRKATAHLPDEVGISYHAYYKGCCLSGYLAQDIWMFPKDGTPVRSVVINPGDDYDHRLARRVDA
jgi:hypothetical protein